MVTSSQMNKTSNHSPAATVHPSSAPAWKDITVPPSTPSALTVRSDTSPSRPEGNAEHAVMLRTNPQAEEHNMPEECALPLQVVLLRG